MDYLPTPQNLDYRSKNTKYPYTWARTIVASLTEKYARASEIGLQVWDITEHHLILFLARGDPFWNVFRRTVHLIARQAELGAPLNDPAFVRRILRGDTGRVIKFLKANQSQHERLRKRLDSL